MNIHISYKSAKLPEIEKEFNAQIEKLSRRLQVFRPDLVHLYGTVGEHSPREGITVAVNLRLPSGQLFAQEAGDNPVAAVKATFSELVSQLKRHKDLLRNERRWYRRRGGRDIPGVPFEDTVAAVQLPEASGQDISEFLNANLPKLERYIERELRYREATGQIRERLVSKDEVLDEVVANALGNGEQKPERLSIERWFYRLALRTMEDLARQNGEPAGSFSLESGDGRPNVTGSDEAVLQFHQPDEAISREDTIANTNVATPEEIAANDEFVEQIEHALAEAAAPDREAFILYAVEGFTLEEISEVTGRRVDAIANSIRAGRDLVKRKLPAANELKHRLLAHTRIA